MQLYPDPGSRMVVSRVGWGLRGGLNLWIWRLVALARSFCPSLGAGLFHVEHSEAALGHSRRLGVRGWDSSVVKHSSQRSQFRPDSLTGKPREKARKVPKVIGSFPPAALFRGHPGWFRASASKLFSNNRLTLLLKKRRKALSTTCPRFPQRKRLRLYR
jgi:hypothetical protein